MGGAAWKTRLPRTRNHYILASVFFAFLDFFLVVFLGVTWREAGTRAAVRPRPRLRHGLSPQPRPARQLTHANSTLAVRSRA